MVFSRGPKASSSLTVQARGCASKRGSKPTSCPTFCSPRPSASRGAEGPRALGAFGHEKPPATDSFAGKVMLFSVLICLSGWVWVAMAPEACQAPGWKEAEEGAPLVLPPFLLH